MLTNFDYSNLNNYTSLKSNKHNYLELAYDNCVLTRLCNN